VERLDPVVNSDTAEIGFRRRLPFGIETTVSLFRATSDLEALLAGENAITEFSRPTVRQGVQLAAHYEPRRWLALDLNAMMLRARFADGGAEYVPGAAERNASASATVRGYGWSASLLVSYLGKRSGIEEAASLRASTFVNARLSRSLSKNTRLSLDVFNLFDQRLRDVDYFSASHLASAFGPADSYLFNPAEPRGFRLKLRTTF
jgi:outer membrane receptor protein involved in Fe transport